MLDFCGEHDIVSDIEQIPIQKINEAYERMLRSDVKYRFVIAMASLPKEWYEAHAGHDRKRGNDRGSEVLDLTNS